MSHFVRSLQSLRFPAVALVVCVLGSGVAAFSRQENAAPADEWNRGTPRGTVVGYLTAAREGRWSDAARYLDLSSIPVTGRDEAGEELARELKIVLDQRQWIDVDSLSDAPEGDTQDGLPPTRERIASFASDQGEVRVALERIRRDDGVPVWKFASGLVARIPALYDEFGLGPIARLLPRALVERTFLEIALWQWIGLIALLCAAWLLALFAARALVRVVRPWAGRTRTELDDRLIELTAGPLRVLLAIAIFHLSLPWLHVTARAREILGDLTKVAVIVAVTWLAFRAIDLLAAFVDERLEERRQLGAKSLVRFGARTIKVAIGALTLLAMLGTLGFDVTAVIAGLGVGGLAVALAAQKTLENVFGAVSLLADQPVRPGDFCRFGDQVGTVEDIGMRSTRVRTLDRTVISIPNAEFASLHLESFAARDRIRLVTTLGLRYETSADQLRRVIVALRGLLVAHPKILPAPLRVRFVGFGAYSLDLELFCYVDTADYDEFLAVREDLFLRMMDAVQDCGGGFAFPSSTTYIARDHGLDAEKSRAAERDVAAWREADALMFPDFSTEESGRLDNTLDWPPRGSPARGASA